MGTAVIIDPDHTQPTAEEAAVRSADYEVLTAADGIAGLNLVRKKRPAIVVTEALLPKMHGFTLCQEIRSDPDLVHTCPIIVASSQSYPNDIRKALELGAISYLVKPFPPARLVEAIRAATTRAPMPAAFSGPL
jgi:DNA-binding response OmpR family regulator